MARPEPPDLRRILAERVVLFDGAMGTMLMAAGLEPGTPPEAANLENPESVLAIHQAYLEAGAEVVQTNTFGGSRLRLPAGLDATEANERAVEIALDAAQGRAGAALVAGDIGPTGRFFPPVGDLTPDAARDAFSEQARALVGAGADLLVIETMTDLREAVEAVRAVRGISDLPVVATLTFDRKPRGFFTMMGDAPSAAAEALLREGADVVGANCTLLPGDMADLAAEFRAATDAPLLFQPNAREDRSAAPGASSREFAEGIAAMVAAGANGVGGCCGTTPRHIRAARERLAGGSR